ncbi:MAG TPA: 5'-nucleotidase C-terminal domain-containing protein [Mycobacteriales bacterium]|nr:5'-nucleotidase C-terminal domain-containing protein [Mycobacteriales bacterium]
MNKRSGRMRVGVLAASAMILSAAVGSAALAQPRSLVDLQLLSVSDWHAQLDPLSGVGGAAVLSAYWNADRAANPNTLTFTAGDAFGGSPPLSAFFDEEPAVRAMNLMGFTADTLGNHNFDRGVGHLQRMVDLAEYDVLAANLRDPEASLTGVAPYAVYEVGGVTVGVVGVINPEAPTLVRPGSFGPLTVTDPVPAANQARARAQAQGAEVVIALTHMGVTGSDPATGAATGPLIDFADEVGGFDVILGDHTDTQYAGIHNNALVVQNKSKGLTYARTTLSIDPENGRVAQRSAQFVVPLASKVTPDQRVVDLLKPYRDRITAVYDTPIGVATAMFPRGGNVERLREVALGNLVTDAMRNRYGTQLAFVNGGGLRAALPSSYSPKDSSLRRSALGYAAGPPYDLVLGDVFTVLPFGNAAVTRTVTGAQLHAALEHSVGALPVANGKFLQVSGLRFTYDSRLPAGSRVVAVELEDGTPILRDASTYTAATTDFLSTGGDGYTMLANGHGVTREVVADVVADHIRARETISPLVEGRIRDLAS